MGKNSNFDTYPAFSGDGILLSTYAKSISENGLIGLYLNNRLGAPEVSVLAEFPCIDFLMGIILWIISWFTSSIPRTIYSYLIITFVLNSISMAWLLRKIKINVEITFVISLLFSFSYYHFYRYIGHIPLSNYMSFAIAIYLACYILNILENENKYTILICSILLGIGYPYYCFGGLILISIAYIIVYINKYQISNIKTTKITIIFVVIISAIFGLSPKIYYSLHNGINHKIAQRQIKDQEIYGLKITKLFIPNKNSKIKLFRDISKKYSDECFNKLNENQSSYLGLIASLGFIFLFSLFIYSFFKKNRPNTKTWLLIDFLSFSCIFLILFTTIGGFGYIFNMLINPIIRAQNRFSIFIMGLSLIVLAVIINKISENKKIYSYIICFIILIVGMFEQYEIKHIKFKILEQKQKKYETFFSFVEKKLPKNSMVYQLPYIEFPENSHKADIKEYEHCLGYLFTQKLKWSNGGIKGRNIIAQNLNIDNGMSYSFVEGIRHAGFNAVYIDVKGYEDKGKEILDFYKALNVKPIISENKEIYVYDISNVKLNILKKLIEKYILDKKVKKISRFIIEIMNKNDITKKNEELNDLVNGIINKNNDTYIKLYKIESKKISKLSEKDFIDYLYNNILKRSKSDSEQKYWLDKINKGITREEIYCCFLSSKEFRNIYKLDMEL